MPTMPPLYRRKRAKAKLDNRASAHKRGYDRRWRRLRLLILNRDPICMEHGCNQPSTDVDHIKPKAEGGSDDAANLQGLCHRHHSAKTVREGRRWGN